MKPLRCKLGKHFVWRDGRSRPFCIRCGQVIQSSRPWRCKLGLHERRPGPRKLGERVWCLRCGATWRSVELVCLAGWRKLPGWRYGVREGADRG